jgi:hypothetical protein
MADELRALIDRYVVVRSRYESALELLERDEDAPRIVGSAASLASPTSLSAAPVDTPRAPVPSPQGAARGALPRKEATSNASPPASKPIPRAPVAPPPSAQGATASPLADLRPVWTDDAPAPSAAPAKPPATPDAAPAATRAAPDSPLPARATRWSAWLTKSRPALTSVAGMAMLLAVTGGYVFALVSAVRAVIAPARGIAANPVSAALIFAAPALLVAWGAVERLRQHRAPRPGTATRARRIAREGLLAIALLALWQWRSDSSPLLTPMYLGLALLPLAAWLAVTLMLRVAETLSAWAITAAVCALLLLASGAIVWRMYDRSGLLDYPVQRTDDRALDSVSPRQLAAQQSGSIVAAVLPDASVRVVDASTRSLRWHSRPSVAGVSSLAVDPTGADVGIGFGNGRVELLTTASRPQSVGIFTSPLGSEVTALAFAGDARRLVAAYRGGVVRVWDTQSGRSIRELSGLSDPIRALATNTSGTRVAIATGSGLVLYSLGTTPQRLVVRTASPVTAAAYSVRGDRLGYAAGDEVIVSSASSSSRITLDIGARVRRLAFNTSGRVLAVGTVDGVLRLYDLNGPREFRRVAIGDAGEFAAMPAAGGWRILAAGRGASVLVGDLP